MKLSWD